MSQLQGEPIRIVTIGGGTGQAELLEGFRDQNVEVTAIVGMADDGGSTGQLRERFGVLPTGDVRQCIAALSQKSNAERQYLNSRHLEGEFAGHAIGNLLLAKVAQATGHDFGRAVEKVSRQLEVRGRVLPVTLNDVELRLGFPEQAEYLAQTVQGESKIAEFDFNGQTEPLMSLTPFAALNPRIPDAIARADAIVVAPGNLYGSLAPALVVPGLRQALERSPAAIIMAANLVNKPNQTAGFTAADYAREVQRLIGAPVLDYVIYNTKPPQSEVLERYISAGELLVNSHPENFASATYEAIGAPLASDQIQEPAPGDPNPEIRSFIRHDGRALAATILRIVSEERALAAS